MEIKIRKPDDFHVHLRTGDLLTTVLPCTANVFSRALVMPNANPPILTAEDAKQYRQEILRLAPAGFEPLMTIKLTDYTKPEMVRQAKKAGVIALKAYPAGVATNSQDGIPDFLALYSVFEEMAKVGMVLSIHGEKPGVNCLYAEEEFLPTLKDIAETFPRLKIVMEHITTGAAVKTISGLPDNVSATITAHHLHLTFSDVVSDKIRPHNFCWPIAKTVENRRALILAATSGNQKFFFGSDSAPHLRLKKESAEASPGIFSAPVALLLLATIFEERNALDRLENFVSRFGAEFYGLSLNEGSISLVPKLTEIPKEIAGIVPFMAGEKLLWGVEG